jgi:MFS family permease
VLEWPDSLRCLRRRNLRLFFAGQALSLVGTWMQSVAMQWLVWRLTRNPAALGAVAFLGQFPVALLGAVGGAVADRYHRRTVVFTTQALATAQALVLAAVTLLGLIRPDNTWIVYALAAALGTINAFDIPARQALLADMGEEDLGNAIALNSSIVNGTRLVGPAIAGVLVAAAGEGVCFLLNAVSYVAILASLAWMRFPAAERRARGGGLAEGVRYALRTPHVRALLAALGTTSVFGLTYAALAPAFADRLGGGARLLGLLLSAAGLGALGGAASLLHRRGLDGMGRLVSWGMTAFGVGLLGFALSPSVPLSCLALVVVGAGFMLQVASTNTLLQSLAPPELRGRVMGLFSMVFVGISPLGALAAGWVAARLGAHLVVGLCASVVLAASLALHVALPELRRTVHRDYPEHFVG